MLYRHLRPKYIERTWSNSEITAWNGYLRMEKKGVRLGLREQITYLGFRTLTGEWYLGASAASVGKACGWFWCLGVLEVGSTGWCFSQLLLLGWSVAPRGSCQEQQRKHGKEVPSFLCVLFRLLSVSWLHRRGGPESLFGWI